MLGVRFQGRAEGRPSGFGFLSLELGMVGTTRPGLVRPTYFAGVHVLPLGRSAIQHGKARTPTCLRGSRRPTKGVGCRWMPAGGFAQLPGGWWNSTDDAFTVPTYRPSEYSPGQNTRTPDNQYPPYSTANDMTRSYD